jgi:hypothetical protein
VAELGRQFGSIASNKAPVAGLVMASYDLFKREISVRLNAFNKRRTEEGGTSVVAWRWWEGLIC